MVVARISSIESFECFTQQKAQQLAAKEDSTFQLTAGMRQAHLIC